MASGDIRKFFAKSTNKSSGKSTKEKHKPRKAPVINDPEDGDDFKQKRPKATSSSKKRKIVYELDSDEENSPKSKRKPSPAKSSRQEVSSPAVFFGSAPVKRSNLPSKRASVTIPESPPTNEPEEITDIAVIEDEPPGKKIKPDESSTEKSRGKRKVSSLEQEKVSKLKKDTPPKKETPPPKLKETPPSKTKKETPPPKLKETPPSKTKKETPPPKLKKTPPPRLKNETPPPKTKESTSESIAPETTTTTPKLSKGASFRAYLDRGGPRAPGSKPIPKGSRNCLAGLTFVFTGVGESLEREEATQLAKDCGAKVTTSLSKKTSYLVVGEEAGESKIAKAKSLNTKQIDEDEFLELIRSRSACQDEAVPLREEEPLGGSSKKGGAATPLRKTKATAPKITYIDLSPATPTEASSSRLKEEGVATPPTPSSNNGLMWVDKYKPKSVKQIIGQQTNKSNAKKLTKWLEDWVTNNRSGVTHKKGAATANDGACFKAALLSGPPGIGKTTTAVLVCKEVGYTYTELNASVARSKKTLQETVASYLKSQTMDSFVAGGDVQSSRRHAIIMDEVDGMSGNEDRGGVQELIQLIKTSLVPVICICNDRQHTKIRFLANHCYDLRFYRPKVEQIKGPMMSVAYKEGIKISPQAMQDIIESSQCDIRQVLHNLSVWTAADKLLSNDKMKECATDAKKTLKMGQFDVIKNVFCPFEKERELTLNEKTDLFFQDYSMGPLFVQENYLRVKPQNPKLSRLLLLHSVSQAADAISKGDLISKTIRTNNSWELLPTQAIFSSVLPGDQMRGSLGRPEFPQWLGQNSKSGKNNRILQELEHHTRLSKLQFNMDYIPFLHSKLTRPLINEGNGGVSEVLDTLQYYNLTREDWENVIDMACYTGKQNPASQIDSKVKATLTRTINKDTSKLLPYHDLSRGVTKKRRRASHDEEDYNKDEDQYSNGEESDSEEENPLAYTVSKTKKNTNNTNAKKRKKQ